MTTPAWLCQVRDLRTAIAADGLTVEGALAQAAADPNLSLFNQDLIRTLLAYTDAEFEAFADYDNPALSRAGKTTMGERFMRAAMAAPVEHVYYYVDGHDPSRSDAAPATAGQAVFWSGDEEPVTVAVPRLSPEELPALFFRSAEGKTQASTTVEFPEGVQAVDVEPEERP